MRYIIVRNAARCLKCNEEIESKHVHDFKSCSCGCISVDGGRDYVKRVGNPADMIDLTEYR